MPMRHYPRQRMRLIRGIAASLLSTLLPSCGENPQDPTIDFVGDSIIARWDINQSFPSYCVYNFGIGGSGIDLIESSTSRFTGNDVVVITGTNNNHLFTPDQIDEYTEKYVEAILALTDGNIFLFSVLPREFPGDRAGINNDIESFNKSVCSHIEGISRIHYIDVYPDFIKDDSINRMYYSDGLHPNSIGYELLTQKLLKALSDL